ncbi:MAG: prenyltransferase/squalene oxidase repeat-containing protein [Phycisphaerae bacterium]
MAALDAALAAATKRLLDARAASGHWGGELSSSALSTATAVFALWMADCDAHRKLIERGLAWLVEHQNADGGWGDTIKSFSNISTTALCWAALRAAGKGVAACDKAVAGAEGWLSARAGDTRPESLASAIAARYGKDRTFSIPILSMLALAGLLGDGRKAWGHVTQLPFELAALPHKWFRFLRLSVVSYALPALIAIGLARHVNQPTWCPVMRLVRRMAIGRTLRVLGSIQPPGGGFLEAAPLTSFVVMNLCAVNRAWNPPVTGAMNRDCPYLLDLNQVIERGIGFLVSNVRPDGSWPIDTNLATWVTTLSVNALAAGGGIDRHLGETGRKAILEWLLGQQYRVEHPYTHAAPGGWAWTDLPGGVPDADDTAGAVLALRNLAKTRDSHQFSGDPTEERPVETSDCPEFPEFPRIRDAAVAGIKWLIDLQNRDGGMPTFCRGWGKLPFDRSAADLTAHAILAMSAWLDDLDSATEARARKAIRRGLDFLRRRQRPDGSWLPLWFGNQHRPEEDNPAYGTARVLSALGQVCSASSTPWKLGRTYEAMSKGVLHLAFSRNDDGGWGGGTQPASSVEETALAVETLCRLETSVKWQAGSTRIHMMMAAGRGIAWLLEHTKGGTEFDPAPIGFYFAKLWYFEKLYPLIFTAAAMKRAKTIDHLKHFLTGQGT